MPNNLTKNQKKMVEIINLVGGEEMDNGGQIVIYTGMMYDDEGNIVPWRDPGESD